MQREAGRVSVSKGYRLGRKALLLSAFLLSSPVDGAAPASAIPVQEASGSGTSLTRLGQAVSKLPIDSESVVVVARPLLDQPQGELTVEQLEAFRSEVQKAVAPLVPRAKVQAPGALSQEGARSLARTRDLSLTYIEPRITSGRLELLVTLRSWSASFWLRALRPTGIVRHQVRLIADADAQVRALFPVARGLLEKVRKNQSPIYAPLAIACGNLGRGTEEVLILGRNEIAVGAFGEKGFSVRKKRALSEISPIAGSPLRAPLASLVVGPRGVLLGTSDREDLVLLDASLNAVARHKRAFPVDANQCARFSTEGITAELTGCPRLTSQPTRGVSDLRIGESWDAVASASLTQSTGVAQKYHLHLPSASDQAKLTIESTVSQTQARAIEQVGSVFALGDINGDGKMDLATSSPTRENEEDTLRVMSNLDQQPEPIARRSMSSISALSLCPFSGKNPLVLIVAAGSEIYRFE